jgi:hypothetical protein
MAAEKFRSFEKLSRSAIAQDYEPMRGALCNADKF